MNRLIVSVVRPGPPPVRMYASSKSRITSIVLIVRMMKRIGFKSGMKR